jgi:hypothetical protein
VGVLLRVEHLTINNQDHGLGVPGYARTHTALFAGNGLDNQLLTDIRTSPIEVTVSNHVQSNLVRRDVKITAKQSRLEQNPF